MTGSSATRASSSSWCWMSRWLVGSSSSSSRGSWARARAIWTRWRSPPERVCQDWRGPVGEPGALQGRRGRPSSSAAEARRPGAAVRDAAEAYDVADGQLDLGVGVLLDDGDPAGDRAAAAARASGRPSRVTTPGGGGEDAGEQPQQRGLARAVRAEQPTTVPGAGRGSTPSRISAPPARARPTRSARSPACRVRRCRGQCRARAPGAVQDQDERRHADQGGDHAHRHLLRVEDGTGEGVDPDQEHRPGERGDRQQPARARSRPGRGRRAAGRGRRSRSRPAELTSAAVSSAVTHSSTSRVRATCDAERGRGVLAEGEGVQRAGVPEADQQRHGQHRGAQPHVGPADPAQRAEQPEQHAAGLSRRRRPSSRRTRSARRTAAWRRPRRGPPGPSCRRGCG